MSCGFERLNNNRLPCFRMSRPLQLGRVPACKQKRNRGQPASRAMIWSGTCRANGSRGSRLC